MQVLVVTSLYPNSVNPRHGIFVHQRIRHVRQAYPELEIKVIAPVPWFPFAAKRFGRYADWAKVPAVDVIDGIEIHHPRYLAIPKIGMYLAASSMAKAILKKAQQLKSQGFSFDLIDGHYYFPDGVAINKIAGDLKVPFVITARGSDIHLIADQYPKARSAVQEVFSGAAVNIAVCQALLDHMSGPLQAPVENAVTIRNGVDLERFAFADKKAQMQLKQNLGVKQKHLVLSVGNLIELKGHHLSIEAIKELPDHALWIIGRGPEQANLQRQIEQLGLQDRVRLIGEKPQQELVNYYQAADCMLLASSREGWANVLLESMACGTPVVATNIWGTPEVMPAADNAFLIERDVESIRKGIQKRTSQEDAAQQRQAVRAHAERFSWQSSSELIYQTWQRCLQNKT